MAASSTDNDSQIWQDLPAEPLPSQRSSALSKHLQAVSGTPQLVGTASDLPLPHNHPKAESELPPSSKRRRFLEKPVWQVGIDWTGSNTGVF